MIFTLTTYKTNLQYLVTSRFHDGELTCIFTIVITQSVQSTSTSVILVFCWIYIVPFGHVLTCYVIISTRECVDGGKIICGQAKQPLQKLVVGFCLHGEFRAPALLRLITIYTKRHHLYVCSNKDSSKSSVLNASSSIVHATVDLQWHQINRKF